jgi:hypothetical protein
MKIAFMMKLKEHTEFKEFLLLCGTEPLAFDFVTKKYKNFYRTIVLPFVLYMYELGILR